MFDAPLRKYIDPPTNRLASWFVGKGVSADQITLVGFFVGLLAVPALWLGYPLIALVFIVVNRMADGLDGAAEVQRCLILARVLVALQRDGGGERPQRKLATSMLPGWKDARRAAELEHPLRLSS